VEALNGHFTEVMLSAEVRELIVGDFSIVIAIVTENISGDIFELIFILFQKSYKSILDFLLIKLTVFISIIDFEQFFSCLSYFSSK
jgi:hypothetical protein